MEISQKFHENFCKFDKNSVKTSLKCQLEFGGEIWKFYKNSKESFGNSM